MAAGEIPPNIVVDSDNEIASLADEFNIMNKLIEIEGDEDQLRQVFNDLVLNGLQPMPNGEELRLDLSLNSMARIFNVTVTDSGCGILRLC